MRSPRWGKSYSTSAASSEKIVLMIFEYPNSLIWMKWEKRKRENKSQIIKKMKSWIEEMSKKRNDKESKRKAKEKTEEIKVA